MRPCSNTGGETSAITATVDAGNAAVPALACPIPACTIYGRFPCAKHRLVMPFFLR